MASVTKLLGCLAARKIRVAFSMPTVSSVGRVHHQQRLVQFCHLRHQIVFGDVVEEFAADVERAAGERDLDLALGADVLDLVLEKMRDMGRIGRRCDGDDRLGFRNLSGGGEYRGAPKTVPDQDRRGFVGFPQMIGGEHEIGDVGGECRIGEFAFAGAEAGEVEPQHRNALVGELKRDAPRRQHVLAAGEAMREQRIRDRLALGQVERRRQLVAFGRRELKAFDRHVGSPDLVSYSHRESRRAAPGAASRRSRGPSGHEFETTLRRSILTKGEAFLIISALSDRSAWCRARPEYPPAPWRRRATAPRRAGRRPSAVPPAGPRR